MDSLLQSECIVPGTLSLVLRMSRIAGVAPLRFKKTRDGWIARVSPAAFIYAQILASFLTLLVISTLAIDTWQNIEKSEHLSSVAIVWAVDLASSVLVVSFAAFTGLSRMKCLVGCIIQMQKINFKYQVHHTKCSNERIRMIVVMAAMGVTIYVLSVRVHHTFITRTGNNDIKNEISTTGKHVFFITSTIILEVIIIQFSQIAMSAVTSLRTLNKYLKSLLQEIVDTSASYPKQLIIDHTSRLRMNRVSHKAINGVIDTMAVGGGKEYFKALSIMAKKILYHKPTNDLFSDFIGTPEASQSIPEMVRQVSSFYCSICDVVRKINDSHGTVLITLLLSLLLDLIITPYHAIMNIFIKSRKPSDPFMQLNWGLLHITNLLMIIEPCHRTHEEEIRTFSAHHLHNIISRNIHIEKQKLTTVPYKNRYLTIPNMNVTKQLLSQMTRFAPPEHLALMSELELFYRHLMLNNVTYSPLAMFTLNRALIVAILGCITTYLVVIIQF